MHGTKRDANKYLVAKQRERDLGQFIEPASISLNNFLERWMYEVAKIKVRQATYNSYESKIKVHIKDTIGLKRLCDLEAYDIQKLYNDMTRRGLSGKTVRHVHNIINPALKQAVKWRLILQNPCENCELPKIIKKEMKCFTPEEAVTFLKHAIDDKYYAAFVLALETGMRPEEYLGLKWSDIDYQNSKLAVQRALIPLKGGGFEFNEPKTSQSRRSIPISSSTINIMKQHKKNQLESKMKILDVYQDNDLIFPTDLGTPTYYGNLDRRHFKKIINTANQRIAEYNYKNGHDLDLLKSDIPIIRLYDLRHTTATLLLLKGVSPKIVSERLGHSSISLTLDTYSHVLPSMQKDATNHLEELLFGT